jgi:hypothetical protein
VTETDAGLVRVNVLAPVVVKERTVFAPAVAEVPPVAVTRDAEYCTMELVAR